MAYRQNVAEGGGGGGGGGGREAGGHITHMTSWQGTRRVTLRESQCGPLLFVWPAPSNEEWLSHVTSLFLTPVSLAALWAADVFSE